MKVICISGCAQHGKDTTATFLKESLESDGYSVLITHYGDLVKYVCRSFFDWDGQKDEAGRSLLQRVGTDIIRAQDSDYWVRFVTDMLTFFDGEWDYVLIPDTRFPNEIEFPREAQLDVYHMRVVRPNFISPLTPEQQQHPSETALNCVEPDCYIINDGTLRDLRKKLADWVFEANGVHQISICEV